MSDGSGVEESNANPTTNESSEAGSSLQDAGAARPRVLPVDDNALKQLFTEARTPASWSEAPVTEETIRRLYDLLKYAPTSANCGPARFIFLTSRESRGLIRSALAEANMQPFMDAPLGVAVCYDPLFFDHLPELNIEAGLRDWFASDVGLAEETAFRNATLQGAYLIMAARSLGLAAWPISGFDSEAVEENLMAETGWRVNFLLGLGYAGDVAPPPRAPRLSFHVACRLF